MKKFIIFLLLAFVPLFTMAQEAPDTVSSDLKHVIYKDVKDVIRSLAETLKVGTEHVYGVLVKQQTVYSIIYLLVLLGGAIFTYLSIYNFNRLKFEEGSYRTTLKDESVANLIFGIIFGFFGLIFLLVGIVNLDTIVTGFVNPEYGAIEKIVQMLK